MPILLPFALGGIALTTLGLGLKWALQELPRPSPFPEGSAGRATWGRHQEAVKALRAARLRVRERARAYGERQEQVWQQTVEPFRALLERLERWEHARADEVLSPRGVAALSAFPREPVSPAVRWGWTLLGVGAEAPALNPMLEWIDRGWLKEGAPPVLVDGVSLYPAAACSPPSGDEAAGIRAFEAACGQLARAVTFLDAVHVRLEALEARVATLHGRASAQLEYLDAESFEEERPEPRERLLRLGALMGALAESLRLSVLSPSGGLAPLPEPQAD